MSTYGERLKKVRLRRKMTQEQLSEKCGISTRSIKAYENNQKEPKLQNNAKIAEVLNIDPNYLLGYTNERDEDFEEIKEHIRETLFAGGDIPEDEQEKFYAALRDAYLLCIEESLKRENKTDNTDENE